MTLAKPSLGLLLTLTLLAACDVKDSSVSGTATTEGSTGDEPGNTTGADPTGVDPSGTTGANPTGVDPGNTSGGDPTGGPQLEECSTIETEIGFDETSVVGITPQAMIDDIAGVYSGALEWRGGPPIDVTETGIVDTTIEVIVLGNTARDYDSEILGCMHDGPCGCNDHFEVDVEVRFSTADGVFMEAFEGVAAYVVNEDFGVTTQAIQVDFLPDDTAGTFSNSSLLLEDGFELDTLQLQLDPYGGALHGEIGVLIEVDGAFGGGGIAFIGAARGPESCSAFIGLTDACEMSGCAEVTAVPLSEGCACSGAETFCVPGELQGDDVPTLYWRRIDLGYETVDEVVEFGIDADLGEHWIPCSEAPPEVEWCSCDGCVE